MDRKLTLSMNAEVIDLAKKYAQSKNISLSRMIENYLSSLTQTDRLATEDYTPTVNRLLGIVNLEEDHNFKEQHANYLEEKYK